MMCTALWHCTVSTCHRRNCKMTTTKYLLRFSWRLVWVPKLQQISISLIDITKNVLHKFHSKPKLIINNISLIRQMNRIAIHLSYEWIFFFAVSQSVHWSGLVVLSAAQLQHRNRGWKCAKGIMCRGRSATYTCVNIIRHMQRYRASKTGDLQETTRHIPCGHKN